MYYLLIKFPEDLKRIIYDFIFIYEKKLLNKKLYVTYYNAHYENIKNKICNGIYRRFSFNTYIERIIKNDADFLFDKIMRKEMYIWGKRKKYRYKGKDYKNYVLFLKELCQKNESTKCLLQVKYLINNKLSI